MALAIGLGGWQLAQEVDSPSRRALLTGAAALAGAGLVKLAAPDRAAAGHNTDIAYDSQTVVHADVTNTTAGSTRISSDISGTAAFVALNNYPVGISRPDGMLGRTGYTTSNCAGVAGACQAASGGIGVLGTSAAADGTGVYGYAGSVVPSELTGGGIGVFGSGPDHGMLGRGRGTGIGVEGEATAGTGVRGEATTGAGMQGQSTSGTGVDGKSATGPGVHGESTSGTGVEGRGTTFGVDGRAQATGTGVFGSCDAGIGTQGITTSGVGVQGVAAANGIAARFVGRTVVEGALEVTGGSPSALVKSADGQSRRLYSAGSPQRLVEVFGEAKIVRGRATVKLDADFDALVAGKGYQVVLTEYGNLGGVYVARRSEHSFQIRCRKRRGRGRVGYRVVASLA
jgi:hypothetical protein